MCDKTELHTEMLFAYISTKSTTDGLELDGIKQKDELISAKGNKEEIHRILSKNGKIPRIDKITSIEVELYDCPIEAVNGGNPTEQIWTT